MYRSRKLNVLFLGGAKRVSFAEQLIKAGKEYGIEVSIFSHELSDCEPVASVGKIIVGSKYASPGIDAEIGDIISTYGIHIVLPFIDPGIEVAARCKDRNPGVFVPVSSVEASHLMFDKILSAGEFCRLGIPVPKTYVVGDISYPAILKPRCGSASRGIMIANSADEMPHVDGIADKYLIQQYIADREEYTVDCYVGMHDNEVKCAVPRLRIATAGGEVTKTETRLVRPGGRHYCSLGNVIRRALRDLQPFATNIHEAKLSFDVGASMLDENYKQQFIMKNTDQVHVELTMTVPSGETSRDNA